MTHLGYIAASYGLSVAIPVAFAISAALRLAAARRRLMAVHPRFVARGGQP